MFLFLLFLIFSNFFFGFFLLEWDFLALKFSFYFNSLLFSFILLLVFLRVIVFRSYYLDGDLNFSYYSLIMVVFVVSILMLNFCNRVFVMVLSWDLLGISSFFLVLYYGN